MCVVCVKSCMLALAFGYVFVFFCQCRLCVFFYMLVHAWALVCSRGCVFPEVYHICVRFCLCSFVYMLVFFIDVHI